MEGGAPHTSCPREGRGSETSPPHPPSPLSAPGSSLFFPVPLTLVSGWLPSPTLVNNDPSSYIRSCLSARSPEITGRGWSPFPSSSLTGEGRWARGPCPAGITHLGRGPSCPSNTHPTSENNPREVGSLSYPDSLGPWMLCYLRVLRENLMEVGWGGSFFPWLLLKGFFSFPRILGLPLLLWEKCLGAKSGEKKKK